MKPKCNVGIVYVRIPEIEAAMPEFEAEFWTLASSFSEKDSKFGDRETNFLMVYAEMLAAEKNPSYKARILQENNISDDIFVEALANLLMTVALHEPNVPLENVLMWPRLHLLSLPETDLAELHSELHVVDPEKDTPVDLEFRSVVWLDVVNDKAMKTELAAVFDNHNIKGSFPKGQKVLTADEMKLLLPITKKRDAEGEIVEITPNELYTGLQNVLRETQRVLFKQIRAENFGKWPEPHQTLIAGS